MSVGISLMAFLCVPAIGKCASRNLTVVVNPAGAGITVVDQVSGVVTQCAIKANFPNNIASCVRIGKVTPDATPPTPPIGLSVYLEQITAATNGPAIPVPGIWTISNTTGEITYCNAVSQGGTPGGSCTSLGLAASI